MAKWLSSAIVILAAVAVLAGSVGTAGAEDDYGVQPGGPGYMPDSSDHWYCFAYAPSASRQRYHDAMAYLDYGTVMSDHYSSTCASSTDVWVYEISPIPGAYGYRGWAPCVDTTGLLGWFCEAGNLFVDPVVIWLQALAAGGGPLDLELNLNKTIRHETGHTAGLAHFTLGTRPNSAMARLHVPFNFAFLAYSPHEVCHIYNRFGGPPC
ncbi:MAG: hypothetical protein JJLCMIEE_01079 [Acidimicrobiales bacterium]|nr:hypothetical protein [Acidimicrobiales bacterium]